MCERTTRIILLGACSCCHVAWNKYIEVSEFRAFGVSQPRSQGFSLKSPGNDVGGFRVFWGLGVLGFGSERDNVNFWGVKCINKLKLNFT